MSEHRLGEIVIERPRGGMRISVKKLKGYKKALQKITNEASEDGLLSPYLIKTRKRTKYFSDHLGPLRRWLRSKVGESWDNVYSELCQQLETRTLSGQHILSHVWGFVEKDVELIDGVPYSTKSCKYLPRNPLNYWREQLYIHPDTKVLCLAKKAPNKPPEKPDSLVVVNDCLEYHKINNLWYAIKLQNTPPTKPVTDIVLKEIADGWSVREKQGRRIYRKSYAVDKRQCNKKEIKFIMQQLANS
jgi:hypothetical protein